MNNRQMAALKWAVEHAALWRGSVTGSPERLDEFDAKVAEATEALAEVGRMRGRERQRWAGKGK